MIPLLSVHRLSKVFYTGRLRRGRALPAVDDVSLEVHPQETVGLVGESGCGKTTLARCALRLLEPDSGSIRFDGLDLLSLAPAALRLRRREFQMIFQDPSASLDPRMNAGQILSEPFAAHQIGTAAQRESWVRELMDAVGLDPGLIGRRPAQLSGGQQQRLVIARALAFKPRLLVADEPVSFLDVSVQAQILNLLSDLRQQYSLALLLISHSLPVIHYLCSRVVVMYLGRVVEESPAESFFSRAMHPYSRLLIHNTPRMDTGAHPAGPAPGAAGGASIASVPAGCRFHPRCPQAMEVCRRSDPQLVAVDSRTRAACFLY